MQWSFDLPDFLGLVLLHLVDAAAPLIGVAASIVFVLTAAVRWAARRGQRLRAGVRRETYLRP